MIKQEKESKEGEEVALYPVHALFNTCGIDPALGKELGVRSAQIGLTPPSTSLRFSNLSLSLFLSSFALPIRFGLEARNVDSHDACVRGTERFGDEGGRVLYRKSREK